MTSRPGFWFACVLLAALFACTLAYRASYATVGDVVSWCAGVALLAWALMRWAE